MPDKTDKTLFTPVQMDLSLGNFVPTSPTRRNDSISRSTPFRLGSFLGRKNSLMQSNPSTTDVAGPRFHRESSDGGPGTAGYFDTYKTRPLSSGMIRERVSTKGIVRDLEPEDELPALEMPLDLIGMVNELGVKRYLDSQTVWEKRFKETLKTVAKQRKRHIDAADVEDTSRFTKLKASVLSKDKDDEERNKVINSAKWSWSWVVAGDENPPPSSIVARRDTAEARRLSKIADDLIEEKDTRMSGNNLWAMIMNALSNGPDHNIPKSPGGLRSPTWTNIEPPSPPRSIFRASGLRSTSSLATSISNDVVRIHRPSFGSLRIGRGRYLDVNGEPVSQRQSIIPELPPALPSVGGLGRDDTFAKLALEGIAEVRVSEDSIKPPLKVDTAKATMNGTMAATNGTTNIASASASPSVKRSASVLGMGTPVKRKAIPVELFEAAGIDPAQSPYASRESLGKYSNASQQKMSRKGSVSALSHKSGAGSVHNGTNGKTQADIPPTPPMPVNLPAVSKGDPSASVAPNPAEKASESSAAEPSVQ
jgi:hypothetical protein